jgi:hypothetical protein
MAKQSEALGRKKSNESCAEHTPPTVYIIQLEKLLGIYRRQCIRQ